VEPNNLNLKLRRHGEQSRKSREEEQRRGREEYEIGSHAG
jgi:hypothetical protein